MLLNLGAVAHKGAVEKVAVVVVAKEGCVYQRICKLRVCNKPVSRARFVSKNLPQGLRPQGPRGRFFLIHRSFTGRLIILVFQHNARTHNWFDNQKICAD